MTDVPAAILAAEPRAWTTRKRHPPPRELLGVSSLSAPAQIEPSLPVTPMTAVPIVPMPAVVAVPAMVPAHLSRQLAGLFLSRHRAGIDQRQRHGTLTRCRDDEQSRNSEKAQNPFRVHLYLPFRLKTAAGIHQRPLVFRG